MPTSFEDILVTGKSLSSDTAVWKESTLDTILLIEVVSSCRLDEDNMLIIRPDLLLLSLAYLMLSSSDPISSAVRGHWSLNDIILRSSPEKEYLPASITGVSVEIEEASLSVPESA